MTNGYANGLDILNALSALFKSTSALKWTISTKSMTSFSIYL